MNTSEIAIRPDPLHAQRRRRHCVRTEPPAQRVHQLIALALELNLDLVIANVLDRRVVLPLAQLDLADAGHLLLDPREVRSGVEANGDLVATGAELDFVGAAVLGTLRRGYVLAQAQGSFDLDLLGFADRGDVLDADQVAVLVVRVVDVDDVRPREAGRRNRRADPGAVDRLHERDLDLGTALEIRAQLRARIDDEHERYEDKEHAHADEPPAIAHEVESLADRE